MSETKRKPDFNVSIIVKENGKTNYYKVGAVWQNSKGGFSGDSLYGRMILVPFQENTDGTEKDLDLSQIED